MPAPVKWSTDQFLGFGSPVGEPELLGLANGRFALGSSSGDPDRQILLAYDRFGDWFLSASSALSPGSVGTSRGAVSLAQTTSGEIAASYTVEPTAGGGNLEDVAFAKGALFGESTLTMRFPDAIVSAVGDQQLHSAVAAGRDGTYAIVWADYVGSDSILFTRVSAVDVRGGNNPVNTTPGLYAAAVGVNNYRPVSLESLSSGNYVVGWTGSDFVGRIRVVNSSGLGVSAEIPLTAAGVNSLWPEIAELASGRFVVTMFGTNAGRFAIYEANGDVVVPATLFSTSVSASFSQRASVAALPDGRFVIVWVNASSEVRGQMFLADGTEDGAEFAVADVTTGVQGRPTVDTLADGRFVVAWETSEDGSPRIKYTIFEPRSGSQILSGTADGDAFEGAGFNDAIYGGLGDDRLGGGAGADYLRGGDGRDQLDGDDDADLLFGEQQNDTLRGGLGDDFLYGGFGDDALSGEAGNDTLYGEEDDDTLNGGADNDVLIGGTGNDILSGADGADSADGGAGDDTITLGVGADYALGGAGVDSILGEAGDDLIYGEAGVDTLDGGADADTIYGGADGDFIQGGAGVDVLIGEAGADTINGGTEDDSIDGGDGNDTLHGDEGADFIQGGRNIDLIFGGADADTLNGGADNDALTGGTGGDTMTGGTGSDGFFFEAGSGVDVITDFEDNIDKLNLSGYADATFANTIIAQSGANTVVAFAGAFADQAILINFTATNLTASDFIF